MLTYRTEDDYEARAIPRGGHERRGVLVYTLHTLRQDGRPVDVLIEFLESTGGGSVCRKMVGLRAAMSFAERNFRDRGFFGKDLAPLFLSDRGRGNSGAGAFLLRVLHHLELIHPTTIQGNRGSRAFILNTAACKGLLFDHLAVPADWEGGALEGDEQEPPVELAESRLTVYTRQFHGWSTA